MKDAKKANDWYKEEIKAARAKLNELQGLVAEHEALQLDNPENWGYVGDMQRLYVALNETIKAFTTRPQKGG